MTGLHRWQLAWGVGWGNWTHCTVEDGQNATYMMEACLGEKLGFRWDFAKVCERARHLDFLSVDDWVASLAACLGCWMGKLNALKTVKTQHT